ncbi:hypothetical protein [Roseomonas sp. KE0001]|uniref:hypothetical protein n=1 Tax=Roseomonas sp. KE0001 TaxID=2479201 RepID=UPI0018DFD778|nr:hypothetical protein [Roseomonas sp. KE0001]MBI0435099.1 hypothetical protein [Roseomonas sp. KE0001]
MRRMLPVLALAAGLILGGCQNPDGSTDWGSTLALGAGAGLATALIAGSLSDDDDRHYRRRSHRRDYGYGYGRGSPYRGGYYGPPRRHGYGPRW